MMSEEGGSWAMWKFFSTGQLEPPSVRLSSKPTADRVLSQNEGRAWSARNPLAPLPLIRRTRVNRVRPATESRISSQMQLHLAAVSCTGRSMDSPAAGASASRRCKVQGADGQHGAPRGSTSKAVVDFRVARRETLLE